MLKIQLCKRYYVPMSEHENHEDKQERKPQSLPEPTGASYYVPPDALPTRSKRKHKGEKDDEGAKQPYKLKHRSEIAYPQAYEPVSATFWGGLSQDQVNAVMRLQAVAMEKTGFEKSAPKFFIENFDPANPNAPALQVRGGQQAVDLVSLAAPRLVLGGVLLGMGALSLALGLIGMLLPLGPVAAAATIALAIGIILVLNARG